MPGVQYYTKDASGNEIPVELPAPPVMVQSLSSFIKDRAGETSTHAGTGGLVGSGLAVFQGVTAGLAGDIPGAIMYGLPGLLGVFTSIKAILTPDQTTGKTDAQIQADVLSASRDQLTAFLLQQFAASNTAAPAPVVVPTAAKAV